MKRPNWRREMLDSIAQYSLFLQFLDVQELEIATVQAVYSFILNGNRNWYFLGGKTPSERAQFLGEINQTLRGQYLVHKQEGGERVPLLVVRVLPKTEAEITRQMSSRRSARGGQMKVGEMSPYKVCVRSPSLRQPKTIPLDMLERVESQ